jgi:hypothetical protein
MSKRCLIPPRALAAVVAAAALVLCLAPAARADLGYAFATQTLTGVNVSGTGLVAVSTGSSTTDSDALAGSGVSHNDPLDAKQSYVGALPPSGENNFNAYSTQGGGTQAGDFTRGDTVIATPGNLFNSTGFNASNVAETALNTASSGPGILGTGQGTWTASGSFTTPLTTTSVTVSFNFTNTVIAQLTGAGVSQASFQMEISIKDQHGHEVDASPDQLNAALSAPPTGSPISSSGSGTQVLSLAGLTAGDTFAVTITGTENTSVSLTAVPEPSSMCLLGIGLSSAAIARFRRKRAA